MGNETDRAGLANGSSAPKTSRRKCAGGARAVNAVTSLGQIRAEEMYALAELAAPVKVSVATLTREVNAGKLRAVKVRGQWRVQGKDFIGYLESCRERSRKRRGEAENAPPPQEGRAFTQLNPDRLLAAWRRQDADPDPPGGRSAQSSG